MRIKAVETFPVRIPLKSECRLNSSLGVHDVSEFLILRILTDAGIVGVGEVTATARWSGETAWGAQALIERILAGLVVGCDPHDIAEIDRRMDATCPGNWFAKSAIEMACWDIQGKAANKPVYDLLGGACRALALRSRFSIGVHPPAEAASRATELVRQGFDTIKVKVGTDPENDIERVRAVRKAMGRDPALVIDANGGWDADTAVRCIDELDDCELALVEQPTPAGDYTAMARVRRETRPPVMADDSCFDFVHAQELVRHACCDVISVYPGKNGGIRKAKHIVDFAANHGVACSVGSNLEWDIATAAMGHLIVASKNIQVETYACDINGPTYHAFRMARNPLHIEGPVTTITDLPGLGVDVDWDLVQANSCG